MNPVDKIEQTQKAIARERSIDETQPHRTRRPRRVSGCFSLTMAIVILLGISLSIYLFAPLRTNILFLGIDRTPEGSLVGRSDSMILSTFRPLQGYVGMLAIPRDLWITIPGMGENRINTAHFFGEGALAGGGPVLAVETVRTNFGVDVHGYVRLTFDGLIEFTDALGGIPLDLGKSTPKFPAGSYVLDGTAALAFVRDRSGGDDFARIAQGQIFMRAALKRMLSPASWLRIPSALAAILRSIDTDVPAWEWPRLLVALLRAGEDGIDARSITREMVQGFTTASGAQVLAPNWTAINPVLLEMFGQ